MGGAVFNYGGTIAVTNSTFASNSAAGGTSPFGLPAGDGLGGAIFNLNGTVSVAFATLANNSATAGGAIYSLGGAGIATQSGPGAAKRHGGGHADEQHPSRIRRDRFFPEHTQRRRGHEQRDE